MKMVCYIVSSRPGKLRIDFANPKQNPSEEEAAEISITASGKTWALWTMGFLSEVPPVGKKINPDHNIYNLGK